MDQTRNHFQCNSSWNAPYTFSGKEKDVETGYGYFGARYYDSGLSIWLSVDPMSDKYPSMSPYNYCANNPVILVDPDGREFVTERDKKIVHELKNGISFDKAMLQIQIDEFKNANNGAENQEMNTKMTELNDIEREIGILEQSSQGYTFKNSPNDLSPNSFGETSYNINTCEIEINLKNINDEATMVHELKHCFQYENKQLSFSEITGKAGILYDLTDEREAFRRESFFGGYMPTENQLKNTYSKLIDFDTRINNNIHNRNIIPALIYNRNIFKQ